MAWDFLHQHQRPNASNSLTQNFLHYSIAKKWQIIPRVSHISCYWMQRVKVQVEPTRSATTTASVKFENNTSGRARLWDTALKFLCPGLSITSPDHLELHVCWHKIETLSIDDKNGRRVRTGSNFEPWDDTAHVMSCLRCHSSST